MPKENEYTLLVWDEIDEEPIVCRYDSENKTFIQESHMLSYNYSKKNNWTNENDFEDKITHWAYINKPTEK